MRNFIPVLVAIATLVLVVVGAVSAHSVWIDVTPDNIGKQPLAFTVTVKDVKDGKEFEITVKPNTWKLPPARFLRTGTVPPVTRVDRESESVVFSFQVSQNDLPGAKFSLCHMSYGEMKDKNGKTKLIAMPSATVFTLSLNDYIAKPAPPPAVGGDPPAGPKWEYKALTFGGDDGRSTKALSALADDGWDYVGPLAGGQVAFRRLAKPVAAAPRAVYLVAGKGPPVGDLARHPDVRVVHTYHDLKRAAALPMAIWIDADAIPLLSAARDDAEGWVRRKLWDGYPFAVVGYRDATYAFTRLPWFGIEEPPAEPELLRGHPPVNPVRPKAWKLDAVQGGFSVLAMTVTAEAGGGVRQTWRTRGYGQEPTLDDILAVTDRLLKGEEPPERP